LKICILTNWLSWTCQNKTIKIEFNKKLRRKIQQKRYVSSLIIIMMIAMRRRRRRIAIDIYLELEVLVLDKL